ncbi:eukaryotic translation initiation factor 3 subunit J [Bombina bombina]|uniref:eukaryotic translation initiation factor 3 subunit J n=1 Tax=Bombina bombina TaxID=8345 RepID=UPI00235A938B|nr:eukaryotic translation initiation factor 3 subunit J [Bombina bombina]
MAEPDSWEIDDFVPEEPKVKPGVTGLAKDRWEGEDEEEEVKDNWDDEEEVENANKQEPQKLEQKVTEKKKLNEKIKEKEKQQKKRQEELKKRLEVSEETPELSAEEQLAEKLRLKKLQEDADLELAKEAFGVPVTGIDVINPSSRDDFVEFGKLLKEKITQYEKSLYYPSFLEALVRDVCISLEIDDLKKITNSLTVLCSEKQKQEKQSKAKKKKKGVVPGGGLKATMKDDLLDYGGLDEGYVREFEDFM